MSRHIEAKRKVALERECLQKQYASGDFSFKNHMDSSPVAQLQQAGLLRLPSSHPAARLKNKVVAISHMADL